MDKCHLVNYLNRFTWKLYKVRLFSSCGAFKQTYEMRLNFVKYLIFLMFLASCGKQEKEIRDYGFPKKEKDSLRTSIKLSEFQNYGILIDRIQEIICNDSIPKIVIEKKYLIRNIYPIVYCEAISINPKGRHYVSFKKGKAYKDNYSKEIKTDSLTRILKKEFAYYQTSNESNNPNSYVIIIESNRNENVAGIEQFLTDLTLEFDRLNTELELNIAFWEDVPVMPPLPKMKNKKRNE